MTAELSSHQTGCCINASRDKVRSVNGPDNKDASSHSVWPPGGETPPPEGRHKLRTFSSAELFAGGSEIRIMHDQALYRLKITRQGKLILNK